MWNHIVLPAAWQKWHSHLYPGKLVPDVVTLEGCKAELTYMAVYTPRWYTHLKMVTHPSTNLAWHSVTSLICPTTLLLCCHHILLTVTGSSLKMCPYKLLFRNEQNEPFWIYKNYENNCVTNEEGGASRRPHTGQTDRHTEFTTTDHVNALSLFKLVFPRSLHLIHQFLGLLKSFTQVVWLQALQCTHTFTFSRCSMRHPAYLS